MNQVARIISTYSADVFGAVSALFELGGMIVIHDPSGCNSTYTTHDEPRWFNSKTLLYISALTERDAILGNDRRFIEDVTKTALLQKPKFIALLSAQMPAMLGIDMKGIAKIIEQNANIKTFALKTTSMQDYSIGVNLALKEITNFIVKDIKSPCPPENRRGVNILGLTPLDFSIDDINGKKGTDKSVINFFEERNIPVISRFAMGNTLDELKNAHRASCNIVVSYGGIESARVMEKAWGMPYIVGLPVGKVGENIMFMLENKKSGAAYFDTKKNINSDKKVYLIHESVIASSLATALEYEFNDRITVINMTSTEKNLMRVGDEFVKSESELLAMFRDADLIIADPMYKPILGSVLFAPLPHIAFSGRTYRKAILNLVDAFPFGLRM